MHSCPRAEVIFSQRRRSDSTYIAQLVGRMVRSPLARRIDADDLLNSVACYLPQFNPKATQEVVDFLTGKTDEMGGSAVSHVFVAPVVVQSAEPRTQEQYEKELAEYQAALAAAQQQEATAKQGGQVQSQGQGQLDLFGELQGEGSQDAAAQGETSAVATAESSSTSGSDASSDFVESTAYPVVPVDTNVRAPKPLNIKPPAPINKRDQAFTPEDWAGIKAAGRLKRILYLRYKKPTV